MIISDLHLRDKTRFNAQVLSLNNFVKLAESKKVDMVFILGDIAGDDAPHRLSFNERLFLYGWVRRLSTVSRVIVLRGNHDFEQEILCFGSIGANVACVTSVSKLEVADCNFVLAPWMPSSKFTESSLSEMCLSATSSKKKNILLGHYSISGSIVGSYEIISPKETYIDSDLYKSFDMTVCGHIHRAQDIGGVAMHVGSPYQVNYGEPSDDDKRCLEIDTQSLSINSHDISSFLLVDVFIDATDPSSPRCQYDFGKNRDSEKCLFYRPIVTVKSRLDIASVDMGLINSKVLMSGGILDFKYAKYIVSGDDKIEDSGCKNNAISPYERIKSKLEEKYHESFDRIYASVQ